MKRLFAHVTALKRNAMKWKWQRGRHSRAGNPPPHSVFFFLRHPHSHSFTPLVESLRPSPESAAVVYNRISHPVGIAAFALFSVTGIPFLSYSLHIFLLFIFPCTKYIFFYGSNIFCPSAFGGVATE